MGIGLFDLVATATLNAQGRIVEANPLMAPVLARGELAFVSVKGATLVLAGVLLIRARQKDPAGVERACLVGSGVYALAMMLTVCLS
ncbi:hypothetical protein EON82_24985 [bacterium]|nr:MAG: hypothetical protein EON82_24985 [bacterium]